MYGIAFCSFIVSFYLTKTSITYKNWYGKLISLVLPSTKIRGSVFFLLRGTESFSVKSYRLSFFLFRLPYFKIIDISFWLN